MAPSEFAGIYFSPEGGPGQSCRVAAGGSALSVKADGNHIADLEYNRLRVSLQGVDDRYLCFETSSLDNKTRLLVPDRNIAFQIETMGAPGQLVEQLRAISSKRIRRSAARWTVLASGAGVVAAIVLAIWIGFGWAVSKVIQTIPVEWETEIGRASAEQILSQNKICTDPELLRATQEIGMRLVGSLAASSYAFKIRVIDTKEINAFALPGGYVFLNRGLVEQADNGTEVAGVLAHEIQHVLGRHGLNNLVRQAGIMLLLTAVAGDAGQLEQFLMYNAASLTSMSFSRDQERAADAKGLDLIRRASLDTEGLLRFLTKLSEQESLPELMTIVSSHPASAERVDELKALLAAEPKTPVVPLKANWADIRNRCSPTSITDPDGL
ncbi:MAG: M48 family metallopeptidase [Proteobacteria bacterium]|nr:M48 family metallopeptidase [Pseudomonadota bacterium]